MRLQKLVGADCAGRGCPAVFATDSDSLVVQGLDVSAEEGIVLGEGERAVEIPIALIKQLFANKVFE